MAGFVPSPETVKVDIFIQIHGRFNHNILHGHFSTVGPVNPASPDNIMNAMKSAWTSTLYSTFMATTTLLSGVAITDLRNSSVPAISSTVAGVLGIGLGKPLSDQTSMVVTERTNKTGRSHRGRIYSFGYTDDAMVADGTILPAAKTAALAFWDAVKAALQAEGM